MPQKHTVSADAVWLPTRQMAEALSISVDTLMRMRNIGAFTQGEHFRRVNPFCRTSPWLWHQERVQAAITRAETAGA